MVVDIVAPRERTWKRRQLLAQTLKVIDGEAGIKNKAYLGQGLPRVYYNEGPLERGESGTQILLELTTETSVGALIPMAILGGNLWSPLAIAIIGGLLYRTFLTLLVVPCLDYAVMRKQMEKQGALHTSSTQRVSFFTGRGARGISPE